MEAIKKKMQAMKLAKETASDRADQLEQRLVEQKYIYDQVYVVFTGVNVYTISYHVHVSIIT